MLVPTGVAPERAIAERLLRSRPAGSPGQASTWTGRCPGSRGKTGLSLAPGQAARCGWRSHLCSSYPCDLPTTAYALGVPDVVSGLLQHPVIRVGRIFTNKLLLAHTTLDTGNNAVLLFPAQHQATPARCTAPLDLHLFCLPSLGAGRADGEFEFLGPHDEGSRRRFAHRPPWIRSSGPASVPKAIGTPASDSRASSLSDLGVANARGSDLAPV